MTASSERRGRRNYREADVPGVRSGSEGIVVPLTGAGMIEVRFRKAEHPEELVTLRDPSVCWGHCGHGFRGLLDTVRLRISPKTYDFQVYAEGYEISEINGVVITPDSETVVDARMSPKGQESEA